ADHDGYGDGRFPVVDDCPPEPGWITDGGDCDDNDVLVNPDALETCDGVDDDCDGLVDAADDFVIGADQGWIDFDQDGYGTCSNTSCDPQPFCPNQPGWSHNHDDCNDANPAQNPGREEIQGNDIDENC